MPQPLPSARLLLISRETTAVSLLLAIGKSEAWQWEQAASGWEALERLQAGADPDLILLDLERGDADGLHTLRWLRRVRPDLPVILLSFSSDPEQRVEAMRLGARDFMVKPVDLGRVQAVIARHLSKTDGMQMVRESVPPSLKISALSDSPPRHSQLNQSQLNNSRLNNEIERVEEGLFFVAASPAMRHLRAQAELVAQVDAPLLILGETGSGKEITARLIHKLSVRSGFPFLKVSCADLPTGVLENEWLGSEPGGLNHGALNQGGNGSFGGGRRGTIFLDEITELSGSLQHRLLQMLQERHHFRQSEVRGAGSDVRIMAASSANIEQALAERRLREDLYYRLSAFSVYVPSLRRRREDIAPLLGHFMSRLAKYYNLQPRPLLAPILGACQKYNWPGNLRELESFVKRYLVVGDEELAIAELARKAEGRIGHSQVVGIDSAARHTGEEYDPHSPGLTGDDLHGDSLHTVEAVEDSSLKSLVQNIKGETERHAIAAALGQTAWNRKAAARLLKVSYRTLLYKIQQYHMTPPEHLMGSQVGNGHALPAGGFKSGGRRS